MIWFVSEGVDINETDDPSQTQPVMYQAVANHPGIKNIYQNQLISTGIITESESARKLKKNIGQQ